MGMSYSFADVTGTLVGPGGVVDLGHGSAVGEEGIKISMAGRRRQHDYRCGWLRYA